MRYKFNPEILTGSPWAGASNKDEVREKSHFLALCVDISKTVLDTTKVTTKGKLGFLVTSIIIINIIIILLAATLGDTYRRTGASNKGGVRETGHFLALCVDISKTVILQYYY